MANCLKTYLITVLEFYLISYCFCEVNRESLDTLIYNGLPLRQTDYWSSSTRNRQSVSHDLIKGSKLSTKLFNRILNSILSCPIVTNYTKNLAEECLVERNVIQQQALQRSQWAILCKIHSI